MVWTATLHVGRDFGAEWGHVWMQVRCKRAMAWHAAGRMIRILFRGAARIEF